MGPATMAVNYHTPNFSVLLAEPTLSWALCTVCKQHRAHPGSRPHFFDYEAQSLELLLSNGLKNL